tara:strand:- start:9 stop:146 length:138 start_codon:yes stop_codon:yes gene_type:complete
MYFFKILIKKSELAAIESFSVVAIMNKRGNVCTNKKASIKEAFLI